MIAKNLINIAPTIISTLLNLLTVPYIIQKIDIELYGQYIFLNILIFMASKINFGFDKGFLKDNIYINDGKLIKVKNIFAITSLILSLLIVLYEFNENYLIYIIIFTIAIYQNMIYGFKKSILLYNNLFSKVGIINTVYLNIILALPALLLIFNIFSITLSFLLLIIIRGFIIANMKYESFGIIKLKLNYSQLIKKYRHYMFSDIINTGLDFIDKIYIKIFSGYQVYTEYTIFHQTISKLSVITQSISALEFSEYIKNNKKYNTDFKFFCIFYLFLYIFVLEFAYSFFLYWLGENEIVINNKLNIDLIVASIWLSGFNHLSNAYNDALGHTKRFIRIELGFFFLISVLYYLAITKYGLTVLIILTSIRELIFFIIKNKDIRILFTYTVSVFSAFIVIYLNNL